MKILMRLSSTFGHEMSLFSHNSGPMNPQGGRCLLQRERWPQLMGPDQGIHPGSFLTYSLSADVHCPCSLPTSASNNAAGQTRARSYQLCYDQFLLCLEPPKAEFRRLEKLQSIEYSDFQAFKQKYNVVLDNLFTLSASISSSVKQNKNTSYTYSCYEDKENIYI